MTEEQIIDKQEEKKKVLVSLSLETITQLTKDGSSIQDKIRWIIQQREEGIRTPRIRQSIKVRRSKKQVLRVLELCRKEGLKIEIPYPDESLSMIIDYGNSEKEPEIVQVSSLSELYEYLEAAWRQAVMKNSNI